MTQLRGGVPAPTSPFGVLPLRTGVLFPGTSLSLTVGRQRSMALLHTLHAGDVIGVVSQRDSKVMEPEQDDLYSVGTFARVVQVVRQGDRAYRLVLEGVDRFALDSLVDAEPYWRAEGRSLVETGANGPEARLLAEALRARLREAAKKEGGTLENVLDAIDDPSLFADRAAAALMLEPDKAIEVLGTLDVPERLRLVVRLLGEAQTMADLKSKIDQDVREHFGKAQREAVLREQLKAIRRELGDEDSEGDGLRAKLEAADLPEEVRKIADRELKRLEGAGGQGPEATVIRTYLDWLASLPWNERADVSNDLDRIAAQLDSDHSGLDDVKKRILEHMAVHKLSGNPRGTILCLVGPPGVGKTSLGQSIASSTGRPFVRIALGGIRDEAEVRGHRRTYIGALPGRIVHALRKAGVKNPVVMLDEIDKLGGAGWGGWPEAALLEVLDPEQNRTFTDHYLETPFDLSEVMFVCTANTLEPLSPPLRDRLEVIEISGYTEPEKIAIARKHLVPKRAKENGVPEGSLVLRDSALAGIIADYTREAGVRQLDREITRLTRSLALEVARRTTTPPPSAPAHDAPHDAPADAHVGETDAHAGSTGAHVGDDTVLQFVIERDDLRKYLGKPRFHAEVAERTSFPGVATGLAWTPFGGDILFIETSKMPGKGRLEITGQLGDVMKESARAALTYVKSHASDLGVDATTLDGIDIHIHVPAGAVPKDGPSAGVTIFTALVSLLSGRRVRPDTAMTGECTLRGRVLPVGGIKAKVLAAHRAGIRRVILPNNNERDIDDVPKATRDDMEFVLATDMSEVLAAALEDGKSTDVPVVPPAAGSDVTNATA